jgi:hypothetical protein
MNRIDDCAVERTLVFHPALSLVSFSLRQDLVQISSEALAHLVCGAIGKGYGNDLIDIEIFVSTQNVKIALDEDCGFTRAGTSRHGYMPVKRVRRSLLFGF